MADTGVPRYKLDSVKQLTSDATRSPSDDEYRTALGPLLKHHSSYPKCGRYMKDKLATKDFP